MKLIKLTLENFQGIKAAEYPFDGHNASIFGDNATGKTTVFNSVTYLLFGKASTGAKNFTPKTKSADGDTHNLNHSVEGVFSMDDGRIITLKKVFHENYRMKRGTATKEFDGHSVDFFVDGVTEKEKDYEATIISLCGDAEKMKMLTMPDYFPDTMDWNVRRGILLDICGDVSDDDVIASNKELSKLAPFLRMPGTTDQYYNVEQFSKISSEKKTEINKELAGIPGRIDEAMKAIPDIDGLSTEDINLKIAELNEEKEKLSLEKNDVLNGNGSQSAERNKIAELNTKLAEARSAHVGKSSKENETTYAAIAGLKSTQSKAKNNLSDLRSDLSDVTKEVEGMKALRKTLLTQYETVQSEQWTETWDDASAVCPTCCRPLPEEDVEKLKKAFEQRKESFNLDKSERLEKINERGKKEADKLSIAELQGKAEGIRSQIEEIENKISDYDQQLSSLHAQIKDPEPFESTEEFNTLTSQITSLREAKESDDNSSEIITEITEKINAVQLQIAVQDTLKANLIVARTQYNRVKELEGREKDLSKQYENIERGLYLCDVFTKTKVGMLTAKINDKFKSVRFRLFIEQQNGGVRDDCEVLVPSEGGSLVPYAFANNAARINAGLEIIDVLSEHWGLSIPVFVDNAESVTRLMQMDTQVIRLVVSEPDKKLRLEVSN